MNEFRVNSDAEIRREAISEDRYCVIVDDFLQSPDELVEIAADRASDFSWQTSSYPGPLFRIDAFAMKNVYDFIRTRMTKEFPFLRGGLDFWSYLSIVTMQPEKLSYLQRICHTDPERRPGRAPYAALVYLFDNESLGGTGFYRWKELASVQQAEKLGIEDPNSALEFLKERFPTFRERPCYMTGSNEIAEHLCTIPARFNRLLFYSGDVPHSGAITAPERLSADVRKGRLTLNVFVSAVANRSKHPPH